MSVPRKTSWTPPASNRAQRDRRRGARWALGLLLTLGLAAGALTGLSGCGSEEEVAAEGPPGSRRALIRVAPVVRRDVEPKVVVVGSVTPRKTSIVASGNAGIVEEFPVEEGQFVREGEVLSELRMLTTNLGIAEAEAVLQERKRKWEELVAGSRQEDIDEAEANMRAAEAVKKNAERKLQRARRLVEEGAINEDEFDDAVEREESARQNYLASLATYERLVAGPRQEEIDQAKARYDSQREHVAYLEAEKEKRITRAPFDGYVLKEHTERGQWLSKGDPVVALARLQEVEVVANVDQIDERHVRLSDEARVHVKGLPDAQWTGRIVAKIPRAEWESGSRGFPVKVRLENRMNEVGGETLPVLKEGMMAEVTFTGDPVDAVLVSKDALIRTSQGTQLFVFEPLTRSVWTIEQGGAEKGNVTAGSERAAREAALEQFDIPPDADLTIQRTKQPKWAVSTEQPDGEPRLRGYLEADNRDRAREQARERFELPEGAPLLLEPQTGTVRRMVVEIGLSDETSIQILSPALEPGQLVVVEGAERLHDYQEAQLPMPKPEGGEKNQGPPGGSDGAPRQ